MQVLDWIRQTQRIEDQNQTAMEMAVMNTFLAWFPPNLWGDLFRFHWTFIRVEEEDRYVIGVCYGDVKPGYLMYFVVDKASQEVRGLLAEEAQAYQPAYWR